MTSTPLPPLRLALAAAPALLADSLRVLLERDDVEVHLVTEPVSGTFDVAVVTASGGPAVDAPIKVVLDDVPSAVGGAMVHVLSLEPGRLDDLAAVVAFVRDVAGDRPAMRAGTDG